MPCQSAGWIEECCSWSSEGSAEMLVGQTFVCCADFVAEGHREPAAALAGTDAPLCLTVGLVVVLVVPVLLQSSSSPDLP